MERRKMSPQEKWGKIKMVRVGEGTKRGQGRVEKEMRQYYRAITVRGILTTQHSLPPLWLSYTE